MSAPLSPEEYAQLCELIQSLHDERIMPEERVRLEDWICRDAEAGGVYVQYMNMYARLRWDRTRGAEQEPALHSEDASTSRAPIIEFGGEDLPAPTSLEALGGGVGKETAWWNSIGGGPFQRGGFVLLLIMVAFFSGYAVAARVHASKQIQIAAASCATQTSSGKSINAEPRTPVIAGRLVRGAGAVWDKTSRVLNVGDPLAVDGVVRLREGTAEIAFDSGARVLLKGPARFALSSPMAGRLHYGSLVTDVPKEARGFVVETPRASIVDYGTSFSLNVDPKDQIEEAFVHQGEIRVGIGDKNDDGEQPAKKLFKGQGVRINADASGNAVMRQIARVSRSFPRLKLGAFQPRLPSEIGDLRLWLRADAGTYQDLDGETPAAAGDRVAQWIDQSGNGLNPRQQVASHRPELVDAGGGRLALRFDSTRRQRLEEPCQTGPLSQVLDASDRGHPQFTICVVFSTVATHMALPQTLFSQFPRSGAQTSRYFGIREDRLFYSEYPPAGIALLSAKETVVPNETYVAVLTRDGDMESIHINGQLLVANDYAERYAGVTPCRWWIGGRHRNSFGTSQEFFCGDLFELIMFSRAIPEKTRENLEMYLKNKYLSKH